MYSSPSCRSRCGRLPCRWRKIPSLYRPLLPGRELEPLGRFRFRSGAQVRASVFEWIAARRVELTAATGPVMRSTRTWTRHCVSVPSTRTSRTGTRHRSRAGASSTRCAATRRCGGGPEYGRDARTPVHSNRALRDPPPSCRDLCWRCSTPSRRGLASRISFRAVYVADPADASGEPAGLFSAGWPRCSSDAQARSASTRALCRVVAVAEPARVHLHYGSTTPGSDFARTSISPQARLRPVELSSILPPPSRTRAVHLARKLAGSATCGSSRCARRLKAHGAPPSSDHGPLLICRCARARSIACR